ncbi:intracellular protein transport protein USO1 [Nicotiana tomentosiformis]|uniref:intracellular protein transport protein USO1 n=1 Tax=Nicotiana tomentosiformis TaxID=4098 RepID=UPI00388CBBA2
MSWLKSAMSKAVEVGNNNNLTRTVKNYADSVVQQAGQAVAELHHRIGNRNFKSFKQTVKRLEEASVSCRGPERVRLLKMWLAVLKEIEKRTEISAEDKDKINEQQYPSEEAKENPRKQSLVLYYDSEMGGEPMNFRDVFLYSQALEGISICMILEAPNEEEVDLLLELFALCLTGGKAVHYAIVSSIQDLAKAFSSYQDEVLVKRDELLQFAESAITGLKINADLGRIDAEVSLLKKKLDEIKAAKGPNGEGHELMPQETAASIEALKEALAHIRVCSKLEGLLLKKKALKYGDSPEVHVQKVDKLKVLSESLASSTCKAEKKISDHRIQKEEALKFRVTKTSEVGEMEKELATEVSALEKQRAEIEAQLKQVNISLAAANARLQNVREERDQFYEANDQIVAHLKTREDELTKSIGSCKVEANILGTWINFLEDTWTLQSSFTESKDKEVSVELEKHEDYFVNLVMQLLSAYEKELRPSIDRISKFVENLKTLGEGAAVGSGVSKSLSPRKSLEEEYLDYEAKIITTFSVVDNMREQFYSQQEKISRKDDPDMKKLFENIEKLRQEFESIERPNLEMEIPVQEGDDSSHEMVDDNISHPKKQAIKIAVAGESKKNEPPSAKTEQALDPEAELAKLESEFGKITRDYSAEEIGDWEFDELEKELKSGDSATSK